MKKRKQKNLDKYYLGFLGVSLFSLVLPWVRIPMLGSITAVDNWRGIVSLFILAGIIALYFKDRRYSYLSGLVFAGGMAPYAIYILFKLIFVPVDLGMFGNLKLINFVGIGFWFFVIGISATAVKSYLELKKSRDKWLYYAIVGAVIFLVLVIYNINSIGSGLQMM